MAAIRRATTSWDGDLASGTGRLTAGSSDAFKELPVTWAARTEQPGGKTSPEELLAAAHASCFSMAFSSDLAKAGFPPQHLDVTAEVTVDRVDGKWTVLSSKLTVHGRVNGIDARAFGEMAEGAKDGCPISRALNGNVKLSVEAVLGAAGHPRPRLNHRRPATEAYCRSRPPKPAIEADRRLDAPSGGVPFAGLPRQGVHPGDPMGLATERRGLIISHHERPRSAQGRTHQQLGIRDGPCRAAAPPFLCSAYS